MFVKKSKLIKGAIILTLGGIIAKILGLFFRLPLTKIVGGEGIGLYQIVFPLYALLLVVSTTGLPVAISKLIAEKKAVGDENGAMLTFKISLNLSKIVGAVLSVIVLAVGVLLAISSSGFGKNVGYGYIVISPSIFFVALLSGYRGYFQGLSNMTPTALTQIIEQGIKVVVSLALAYLLLPFGLGFAVAGALLGITVSELVALLAIYYYFKKKVVLNHNYMGVDEDKRNITRHIIALALPISVGACVLPLSVFFDSYIAISILTKIGYSISNATTLYGLDAGIVSSITNIPIIISSAIALSLIPVLSKSIKQKDANQSNFIASLSIKICYWILLPAIVALLIFPEPIVNILYGGCLTVGMANQVQIAGKILLCNSVIVLLIALTQVFTSINQAAGKIKQPVYILIVGVILKIIFSVIFLHIPSINILGLTFGSLSCFVFAMFLNYKLILDKFCLNIKLFRDIIIPLISSVFSGIISYMLYILLSSRINKNLSLLIGLGILGFVYVCIVFLFNRKIIKDFYLARD